MLELTITPRETGTSAKRVRAQGLVPGIVYGRSRAAAAISVPAGEFYKVWREAGESSIISLSGLEEPMEALIYDVQVDPVSEAPIHIDFYAVEKGRMLEVSVPLEFVGESPAVKTLGGTLVKVLHELDIEATPANLPHEITVDVSGLTDFDTQIHVRDIVLPEGVEAKVDPDEVVVLVSEGVEEPEEIPEAEGPDLSAIEVEERGKGEDASAEGTTEDTAKKEE